MTDCYEKGHTPCDSFVGLVCAKCKWALYRVQVNGEKVWHTQAELDRLWKGVDREAARTLQTDCHTGSV